MSGDSLDVLRGWLERFRQLAELSLARLTAELEASPTHVDRDARYGHMGGLVELYQPALHPARFYFRDPAAPSVVAYAHFGAPPAWLSPRGLADVLGEPDQRLSSRAGKAFAQHVLASQGWAYAATRTRVAFIERFAPCAMTDYVAQIYTAPGAFVR